jgi:hypothetical protein
VHAFSEDEPMAESCVVGVYSSLKEAQAAAHILDRAKFPRGQTLLVGSGADRDPKAFEDLSMGDDSVRDAALGAGVGGVLGVLAGASAATLSGLVVLLIAGPLAGGLAGAVVGAFVGSLAGWGVHDAKIAHYEASLKSGKSLLIAEGGPLEVAEADRILQETGPIELHVFASDGSESGEILDAQTSTMGSLLRRAVSGASGKPHQ